MEQARHEPAYHALGAESISYKALGGVIGEQLGLPGTSRDREHFGWLANFLGADMSASSAHNRTALAWTTTGPDLLTDLRQGHYFSG